MSDKELKIRKAAAHQHGWKEADVEVQSLGEVTVPSCGFYTAWHKTQPTHAPSSYAVLPTGTVVNQGDKTAVEQIVAACDTSNVAAGSWAELIARFHASVGPGVVLHKAEAPIAEGTPAGPFAPPRFVEAEGKKIHFYLRNHETMKLYEVSASIADGQVSDVSKKAVD